VKNICADFGSNAFQLWLVMIADANDKTVAEKAENYQGLMKNPVRGNAYGEGAGDAASGEI